LVQGKYEGEKVRDKGRRQQQQQQHDDDDDDDNNNNNNNNNTISIAVLQMCVVGITPAPLNV